MGGRQVGSLRVVHQLELQAAVRVAVTERIQLLQAEIAEYYGNYKVGNDLLELRNLAMVAELMIRCAISRRESRGLHYTLDYPDSLEEARDTVLRPQNSPLSPTG